VTPLDHARALVELLEQEQASPPAPPATMGVKIEPAELAKLMDLAARMGLPPALVFKLALEALEQVLAKPRRMVGRERGLLEAKR